MGRYQNDISWLRDAIGAAGGSQPSPSQRPAFAKPGLAAAIGDEKVVEEKRSTNPRISAVASVSGELAQRSTAKPLESADCPEALEEPDVEAKTAAEAKTTSGTTQRQ